MHQDDAPSHTAIIIHQHFIKKQLNVVPQARIGQIWLQVTFSFFPLLNLPFPGARYESLEAIQENTRAALKDMPKI